MRTLENERLLFILRRACLLEQVKRVQLIRIFSISPVTAQKSMMAAAERWPDFLSYTPSYGVRARPFATPPEEASSSIFLTLLESGAPPQALGLLPAEAVTGMPTPRFVYRGRDDRGLVLELFRACLKRTPLDIEYVGLRRGEERRVRTVLPLEMELLGNQWRVVAHDLDAKTRRLDGTQKTFVLARILNAQLHQPLQNKKLKNERGQVVDVKALRIDHAEQVYEVHLNAMLTPDQVEAVVREFALVRQGTRYLIRMPVRNLAEFKRDHCARPVMPNDENELKDFVLPVFERIRPHEPR